MFLKAAPISRDIEKADYADIVTVARLQTYVGTQHPLADVNWADVTAFARLGLPVTPGESDEAYQQQIELKQGMLRD